MNTDLVIGILLVVLAGIGTGTCIWPIKRMRQLQFEHWWFLGMLVGLVIIPWTATFLLCPRFLEAYAAVPPMLLVKSNLYAMAWGVANVLYAVCAVRIGVALTGALLCGSALAVGVTLPMIVKATGIFASAPDIGSAAGRTVLIAAMVALIGVALVAVAGFDRERVLGQSVKAGGGQFGLGLALSLLAGLLSCGSAFAFVYSQGPIIEAMKARGAAEVGANISVWAAGLAGGALVNLLYPAILMTRRGTWHMLVLSKRESGLALIIGLQFIVGIILSGLGMLKLGTFGASVGFGIMTSLQILGSQALGLATGEWRGVSGRPWRVMLLAIGVLLLAVILMALSNTRGST